MGDTCPTVHEYAGSVTVNHRPPDLRITHHYVKDAGRWVCVHCGIPKEQG